MKTTVSEEGGRTEIVLESETMGEAVLLTRLGLLRKKDVILEVRAYPNDITATIEAYHHQNHSSVIKPSRD